MIYTEDFWLNNWKGFWKNSWGTNGGGTVCNVSIYSDGTESAPIPMVLIDQMHVNDEPLYVMDIPLAAT